MIDTNVSQAEETVWLAEQERLAREADKLLFALPVVSRAAIQANLAKAQAIQPTNFKPVSQGVS